MDEISCLPSCLKATAVSEESLGGNTPAATLWLEKKAAWVSKSSRAALSSPLKGQDLQGQSYPPTS